MDKSLKNTTAKMNYDHKLISILVPVFNEELTIDAFFERMDPVVARIKNELKLDVELVFTDNSSIDSTYNKILAHAKKRDYVKLFKFSKNVGFQRSIISGYAFTKGAACVQIDCDLEDPPELIIDFIKNGKKAIK